MKPLKFYEIMKADYLNIFYEKLTNEEKEILKYLLKNQPIDQLQKHLKISEQLLNKKIVFMFEKINIRGKVSIRKFIQWAQLYYK